MSYKVELINFEGPLDLLMQLIEREELTITEISLAAVTDQYLRYVSQLREPDPAELNWFIELAAKLIYIKSAALLPGQIAAEAESESAELARQIEELRRFQKAAEYLRQMGDGSRRSYERPLRQQLDASDIPLSGMSLDALKEAFETALTRLPKPTEDEIIERPISLEEMMRRLSAHASLGRSFSDLLGTCTSRLEAVVVFLALLEMLKLKQIAVTQDSQFGDIRLEEVPG